MSDDELILRFRQGQKTTFNLLVKRWERPIYNFALRQLGDREEARDVCQKAFI